MPQHEHMEKHKKLHGERMDKMERDRKREARRAHKLSEFAQKSFGLRAKLFNQKRFKEKATMKKTLSLYQEGSNKHSKEDTSNDSKFKYDDFLLMCTSTVSANGSGINIVNICLHL